MRKFKKLRYYSYVTLNTVVQINDEGNYMLDFSERNNAKFDNSKEAELFMAIDSIKWADDYKDSKLNAKEEFKKEHKDIKNVQRIIYAKQKQFSNIFHFITTPPETKDALTEITPLNFDYFVDSDYMLCNNKYKIYYSKDFQNILDSLVLMDYTLKRYKKKLLDYINYCTQEDIDDLPVCIKKEQVRVYFIDFANELTKKELADFYQTLINVKTDDKIESEYYIISKETIIDKQFKYPIETKEAIEIINNIPKN
jgi:hypothetical protein